MPLEEMFEKSSVYEVQDLIAENYRSIPTNGRGIYALFSLSGKTLYVGKSDRMRTRIKNHLRGNEKITERYSTFVDRIKVFYLDDEIDRQKIYSVEYWFIEQLNAIFNVTRFSHTARVT
jgi:excinuclease UvrABC nuclease subunit